MQPEVFVLGHVVSGKEVLPDASNVAKIIQWPKSVSFKQIKQSVAMGSYYRRFKRDFAKVTRPWRDVTKCQYSFHRGGKCDKGIASTKQAFLSPEVTGYPK